MLADSEHVSVHGRKDTWELISTTTTACSCPISTFTSDRFQTNMSRKAAIIEEFDDDTDLPLPSLPLPNTGSRGPLIQELHISDDEFEPSQYAGPASPPRQSPHVAESTSKPSENQRNVMDITPYKTSVSFFLLFFLLSLETSFLGNLLLNLI
jgi:hypothetical protein